MGGPYCLYTNNLSHSVSSNFQTSLSSKYSEKVTLGGDKVSVLIHTYPHKPLTKIKVTICNHQADSQLYVRPNDWSGDLQI